MALASVLNERARRIWAAAEAKEAGRGGITLVARATGISYSTIVRGLKELESEEGAPPDRVRRVGGGRKKSLQKDPTLADDLESLVEPAISGDPQSALRWTSRSVRTLSRALRGMGHAASHQLVAEMLSSAGYSLQSNRKGREGPNTTAIAWPFGKKTPTRGGAARLGWRSGRSPPGGNILLRWPQGRAGSAQPNASAWCRCAGRSCESSRGRESW